VLISSHGLNDLERFTDHVGIIKNGRLVLEGRTERGGGPLPAGGVFQQRGDEFSVLRGAEHLEAERERWQALLDQKSGAQEWLQARGAEQISLTRLTLEDLFVALFKEKEGE